MPHHNGHDVATDILAREAYSREMQARELQAREMLGDESEPPAIDFLGPILRRKSIIVLFCLVGAGIGYLLYKQEKPTYQSALRLMVWTQAPPSIVKGDLMVQGVSLAKQTNLIKSQLVLASAIERGNLPSYSHFEATQFRSLHCRIC